MNISKRTLSIFGCMCFPFMSSVSAEVIQVVPLNMGVAVNTEEEGQGYILYSQENVHSRFSVHEDQANHFIAIKRVEDEWQYSDNNTWKLFNPKSTDVIVALVDFTENTAQLQSEISILHGIRVGLLDTDLAILPEMWGDQPNSGQFGITGSFIKILPNYPTWWTEGDTAVVDPNKVANGKTIVKTGQAKWMTYSAIQALRQNGRPILAEVLANSLAGEGKPLKTFDPPTTDEERQKNLGIVQVGHLKALSAPFYKSFDLVSADWAADLRRANGVLYDGTIYPWSLTLDDDQNLALATQGQLKNLFSFNINWLNESVPEEMEDQDLDGDGIPDLIELAYNLDPLAQGTDATDDLDEDGLTNLQEIEQGRQVNYQDHPAVKLEIFPQKF